MSAQTGSGFSLTLDRHFDADRDAVFRAWTDAAALAQWFAPADEFRTVVHELDVRVGGKYRIAMHEADGIHVVYGEYVHINAPDSLVFTWAWEHDEDAVQMLVSIELAAANGGTDMRLLHERLPSETSRDLHNEGWAGCLARLAGVVEQ
jgi:uncharacterized protein YndB with AHSA1/START domain